MMMNKHEIDYSLQQLLRIAGGSHSNFLLNNSGTLPVKFKYLDQIEECIQNEKVIYIRPADSDDWENKLTNNLKTVPWTKTQKILPPNITLSISDDIPLLFIGNDIKPIELIDKNTIVFNFDILSATFLMLNRIEERKGNSLDRYKRFPANKSIAYKYGFLKQPIIDEYAMILRAWIQFLQPAWRPEKRKPEILLTHDIDFVRTIPNYRKLIRKIIKSIKPQGVFRGIGKNLSLYREEKSNLEQSKYVQNIHQIIQLSKNHSLRSIFFFKASRMTFFDSGYHINNPVIKNIFNKIKESNFSIGLHPGFYTYANATKISKEKEKLERASGLEIINCRQHYLRFNVKKTWAVQQNAGLKFDFTLGFAGQEGYRCGTCHPYHPYNFDLKKEMIITEVPLIVMDTTLFNYRHYSPEEAKDKIIVLVQKSMAVEGTFTLLWHNTSFGPKYKKWEDMYLALLKEFAILK